MNTIKKLVYFLPLFGLSAVYAVHALGVFSPEEMHEYLEIIEGLGLSPDVSNILAWGVLPLDGTVVLLLLFGNKLMANFPWKWLFLWAGLWPWVPRTLEIISGLEPEYLNSVVASILAVLAYYVYQKQGSLFKR